jgi:hypothetical protein
MRTEALGGQIEWWYFFLKKKKKRKRKKRNTLPEAQSSVLNLSSRPSPNSRP